MKMTFQPKKRQRAKVHGNRSQKIKRKKKIISIGHNFCGLFFIFDCF